MIEEGENKTRVAKIKKINIFLRRENRRYREGRRENEVCWEECGEDGG